MRVYRERLAVPASWWAYSAVCVVLLGTTLWAGFSELIGLAVYVVLMAGCAVMLLNWGGALIEVTSGELVAGRRRMPLSQLGEVSELDPTQSKAIRGPRADPAAYLLIRPYLPKSVYVEIAGRPAREPYWLIASRKPALLAAAIEQARLSAGERVTWDDAAGDDRPEAAGLLEAGAAQRADATSLGKDGNGS